MFRVNKEEFLWWWWCVAAVEEEWLDSGVFTCFATNPITCREPDHAMFSNKISIILWCWMITFNLPCEENNIPSIVILSEWLLPSCGSMAVLHWDALRQTKTLSCTQIWVTLCSASNSQRQSDYATCIWKCNKDSTDGLKHFFFNKCWQKQKAQLNDWKFPFCPCFMANVTLHGKLPSGASAVLQFL